MKPYLKQTLAFIFVINQLSISSATQLLVLDASGRNGEDGRNGISHSGSASDGMWGGFASNGSDGRDGGDASHPTHGQSAGSLNLQLSRSTPGTFTVQGVVVSSEGHNQRINNEVRIGTEGFLSLQARGGDGGKGGDGGDGEHGGDGGRGSDATRSSNGSNGGNGGHGGDSGAGTSGAKAGNGGNITIELKEADTALLMLVASDQKGGKGGDRGRHGTPGSGGSGGYGGSSESWDEKVHDGYDVSRDSEGNETRTERTRTEHHSNPGGSNGYSGSSGTGPSSALYDGQNGRDGEYKIRVLGEDGSFKEYSRHYDLSLQNYDIVSENQDGILEPGEKVHVQNVKIKNTGGMPTPSKTKIRIFLTNTTYSIADSIELTIPRSLQPDEEFTFSKENLSYEIKSNILAKVSEERARWSDHVRPLAEMTEVDRRFKNFSTAQPVEITYPIEIEPIATVRSLAPGEKAKILLKVTNISNKDFGSESEIKRAVSYLVKKFGGDLDVSEFALKDLEGKPLDMSKGFLGVIKNLKSKTSTLVEAELNVSEKAGAYKGAEISFGLNLGKRTAPDSAETIQDRRVTFRVSQTYRHTPDAKYLLVVNSGTSRHAMEAWRKSLASFGQQADIWDLSYYGHIGLTEALENGSSLAKDFQGKTLIVLNNEFQTNQGNVRASEFVARQALVEAASKHKIGTLFVGSPSDAILDKLMNLNYAKASAQFYNISKFLKSIRHSSKNTSEDLKNSTLNTEFTDISVSKTTFIGKINNKDLIKQADKLQRKLAKHFPERTYQVVYDFSPELIRKGFLGIGKKWSLGSIQVYRTLDTSQASVITLNAGDQSVLNPETITGNEVKYSVLLATPFEQRLNLLQSLAQKFDPSRMELMNLIVSSIQQDLMIEQSLVRKQSWTFGLSKSDLAKRLSKLSMLSEMKLKLSQSSPQEVKLAVLKIFASLEILGSNSVSWWEYLTPFRRNPTVNEVTAHLVDQATANLFEQKSLFGSNPNAIDKKAMSQLKTAAKELAEKTDLAYGKNAAVVNSLVKSEAISSKTAETRRAEDSMSAASAQNKADAMKSARSALTDNGGVITCEGIFK